MRVIYTDMVIIINYHEKYDLRPILRGVTNACTLHFLIIHHYIPLLCIYLLLSNHHNSVAYDMVRIDDEMLEVTPAAVRLRKVELDANKRAKYVAIHHVMSMRPPSHHHHTSYMLWVMSHRLC